MIAVERGGEGWPARFEDLATPPARLHVRAPADRERLASLLEPPVVAIVGSRDATIAGAAFAEALARALAGAGACVVSGLARGIDAAAHAGALAVGGRTVAVLGCGVDRDYPAATAALASRIAVAGAVVSEYPPGVPPAPFRFPERNRLVAALADAVVVVEAARRSGALITARLALDLGRDVLAVPGAPWSDAARGANALLRDGAILCGEPADALLAVGLDPGAGRADDPALPTGGARVLAALRREPASIDVLAVRCGLAVGAAAALVAELELRGVVAREADGRLVPIG